MNTDPLYAAALDYAGRGWPVFPIKRGDKRPLTPHGFKDASTDPEVIDAWWKRFPGANIGIATGPPVGVVLDLDGNEGISAFRELIDKHGELPKTASARTGGGGMHLFFHGPDDLTNARGALPKKIDVRALGGYIVAPPSIHPSGDPYRWARAPEEAPIAPIPPWLLNILRPPELELEPRSRSVPKRLLEGAEKIARVDSALDAIDTFDDHDMWIRIGQCLHWWDERDGGAGAGRAAWDTWSARSSKYNTSEQEKRWGSFDADKGVTLGTLFAIAEQCGWSKQSAPAATKAPAAAAATPNGPSAPAPPSEATGGEDDGGQQRRIYINTNIELVVDDAESALLAHGEPIYQRGCVLVEVQRSSKGPRIKTLAKSQLREAMRRAALWVKIVKGKDGDTEERASLPPNWAVETLFERGRWAFAELNALTQCPTLRSDGTVIDRAGLDVASGIYFEPGRGRFPRLPKPTRIAGEHALKTLDEVVCDFPFEHAHHRAAAIAAIITAVVRPGVSGPTPLFLISSPTPGSGKGLLKDVIALIATGRGASPMSQGRNEDEERKRITSLAIECPPLVCIDNITRPLGSGALDAAITSDELSPWQDRLLGVNATVRAALTTTWLATGNNVKIEGDLARRTVPIIINPGVERPEEREGFKHPDLKGWVIKERRRLAIAALTVVRAYIDAGCPAVGLQQMGSFEHWSRWVRCALAWLGQPDCNAGQAKMRETADVALISWGQVLDALTTIYGEDTPFTSGDVADELELVFSGHSKDTVRRALRDALSDLKVIHGRQINTYGLGRLFGKYEGRIISGRKCVRTTSSRRGQRWCVTFS